MEDYTVASNPLNVPHLYWTSEVSRLCFVEDALISTASSNGLLNAVDRHADEFGFGPILNTFHRTNVTSGIDLQKGG